VADPIPTEVAPIIHSMVEAALPDDVAVYAGQVPQPPPLRYVVIFADPGHLASETVDRRSSGVTWTWQTTCVAPDRDMAAWLAMRVRDTLVDKRPVVVGWSCGMIEHTLTRQPRRDEQVLERPSVFTVDQYRLVAERVAGPTLPDQS